MENDPMHMKSIMRLIFDIANKIVSAMIMNGAIFVYKISFSANCKDEVQFIFFCYNVTHF